MKPLYKYSAETARHNGELDAWRESKKENIRCRDFLDEQIAKRFDGMTLPSDCVENTVKEFGYDRTMWVIANTIQNRKGDGRFHSRNTEWAKRFNIPDTGRNYEFALNSHSCLVDGAADDIATEQALCALTAYARLLNGQTALYDMTDLAAGITPAEPDAQEPAEEQEPAAQNGAVVWIVVAAAAAAAGAAVIAASKRRKKE